jgi:hypothetical protein
MSRRRKARRRLIKAGVVLSVFCLALWLASRIWIAGYQTTEEEYTNTCYKNTGYGFTVRRIGLNVCRSTDTITPCVKPATLVSESRWVFRRQVKGIDYDLWSVGEQDGWSVVAPAPPSPWESLKPVDLYAEQIANGPGSLFCTRGVCVKIWALFLLCAIPTALLWWRERRYKPDGVCKECGYNLTGNVSGICPECGTGIGEAGKAA